MMNLSGPQELIEVNSGAFNDRLTKAVKMGKKHVFPEGLHL